MDHWSEAAIVVKEGPQPRVFANAGQQSKRNNYGTGKGQVLGIKQGDFPFEIKLAEVTEPQYDLEVWVRSTNPKQYEAHNAIRFCSQFYFRA